MIKELIAKVKAYLSHERCYSEMEEKGIAAMSRCRGLAGGDSGSDYLQYNCMDCPHLCIVEEEVEE